MAMVQDPATTEYDGMPRSAIATGLVDYELQPNEWLHRLLPMCLMPSVIALR